MSSNSSPRPRKWDPFRLTSRLKYKRTANAADSFSEELVAAAKPSQTVSPNLLPAQKSSASEQVQELSKGKSQTNTHEGSDSELGERLLHRALENLSLEDRQTLKDLDSELTIDSLIQSAYDAAREKKRMCESKRWLFTFRGKDLVLRNEADKVVQWLDRFKTVGDVAANVDPMHIGLPWAGIRLLLEVQ
jgi:hypothetical protein